jgi:hypothetical protein
MIIPTILAEFFTSHIFETPSAPPHVSIFSVREKLVPKSDSQSEHSSQSMNLVDWITDIHACTRAATSRLYNFANSNDAGRCRGYKSNNWRKHALDAS